MALKDGINHLPVSFLARHIFDNIKDRLIKGDSEQYMALFSGLAEDLNVSVDEIAEAVLELRAQSILCLTEPTHNALIGFRLSRMMLFAVPVTLGSGKPAQKSLVDVPAEAKKTREELGRDEAVVDGRKTFGRLDATGGADQPFELTITQWPLKDGVEDPFGEDEVKVDKLPFATKAEAWKFFDEWTTVATGGEMTPELAAAGATPPPAPHGKLPKLIAENEFYSLSVTMIDGEVALEFLSNNELKPFDLSVFLAGQESAEYVVSEVATYASGPNFAGKNPEWPMQQLEADVAEALAFALAQVATTPQPETDGDAEAGKPKRGRKAKPATG